MDTLAEKPGRINKLHWESSLWLLLAALLFLVWITMLPGHIRALSEDWLVSRTAAFLGAFLPIEWLTYYIIGWQMAGAGLFLFCALVIFREVILTGSNFRKLGFWAALILLAVPVPLYMNAAGPVEWSNVGWDLVLGVLQFSVFILGIAGFMLLSYLFPYGLAQPRWARLAALLVTLGLAAAFAMLAAEVAGDAGWGLAVITMLLGLLVGAILQITRYRRYFTPEQKQQCRPLVVALLLSPLWLVASMLSDPLRAATGSDWFVLIELHLQLILPLLIPLALLFAMLRRGLWDISPAASHLKVYVGLGLIMILGILAIGVSIQTAALGAAPDPSQPWVLPEGTLPRKIIVDTDLGNDDVLALLFLMQHPGVDLQAITVVGTGLVHCAPGVKNVHGLLELTSYADLPVSCGAEEALGRGQSFPAAWRAAADRLWGLGLPLNDRLPASLAAPDLIAEQLRQAEAPLTILALGPMTNLAQALKTHPEILPKIERLYSMGGAVEVPGNVYDPNLGYDNRTAEWNYYADPEAARQVFESGVPITLVPLDATNDVPVGMPLFRLLAQHHSTRPATFTYDIFYINQGWIQSGGYYLWDTLAATVLTNPEVATYQDYQLQVITEPGPDYGRTVSGDGGLPVRVAIHADKALFEEIFLRVINTENER